MYFQSRPFKPKSPSWDQPYQPHGITKQSASHYKTNTLQMPVSPPKKIQKTSLIVAKTHDKQLVN